MTRTTRTLTLACGTAVAAMAVGAGPAVATPDIEVFDKNDRTWGCEDDIPNFPDHHCINLKSRGNTGVIKVFAPDPRWPQEGVSEDPKSATRPCPHDPDAVNGTWWEVRPGLWVCHHRPSR